jgi:tetratricopeptide (TPR) repeat protein
LRTIRAVKSSIFVKQRNYALAEKELEKAIAENPAHVDALVRFTELYYIMGKAAAAAEKADQAILLDPKNPKAIVAAGIVDMAKGDAKAAIARFDEAVALDPNNYLFYLYAAQAALKLDEAGKAKGYVDAAGQLKPGSPEVANYRGQVLRVTDSKQSTYVFKEAIEKSPDDPRLPYQLGITFMVLGAPIEAIDAFKEALRLDPSFTDAHFQMGMAQKELGRTNKALKAFRKVIQLDPLRPEPHLVTAEILTGMGDAKGALRAFEGARKANPKDARATCQMGLTLVAQLGDIRANLNRGIVILEKCVTMNRKHESAWKHLGTAYKTVGKRAKAKAAFATHLDLHPDDPENDFLLDMMKTL